ncbi:MAG: hypothetical protein JSV45_02060 [Chromatiales bacterium]|nr:MAG: hypothetical protein JSV45_02060 [Chromatiales bacterium]
MNTAKMMTGLTLSAALFMGANVQAATPGEVMYRAELDRCLAALRAELEDPATTKILYTVRDIDKQGAWYQFDIESEVYQGSAEIPVHEQDNRCRARRWSDQMEITG